MPELPEGTINAFIQNKNLAKYGLLKDNEGGFLAENFVDYQLIDRHETLEEIVAVGWMSDFHPFNKDLVADPSPKILVIVDSCVEIKILRHDACSTAWRCRFLSARRSQHG